MSFLRVASISGRWLVGHRTIDFLNDSTIFKILSAPEEISYVGPDRIIILKDTVINYKQQLSLLQKENPEQITARIAREVDKTA